MNKAIFLDRDGTINVDKGYIYKIEDFEFIPGVFTALKLLQEKGYILIIVTNQSGIARGYYTVEDFNNLNDWMIEELKSHGVNINKVYYCPHHPEGIIKEYGTKCKCRKPNLGMFNKAIKDFNIDTKQSYAIGDNLRDLSICGNSNVKGILVCEDNINKNETEDSRYETARDLLSAAKLITNQMLKKFNN